MSQLDFQSNICRPRLTTELRLGPFRARSTTTSAHPKDLNDLNVSCLSTFPFWKRLAAVSLADFALEIACDRRREWRTIDFMDKAARASGTLQARRVIKFAKND